MLSINTNLSSTIVQNSMGQATTKLNQAIERMSTGFKINHASDNAANYSISTNMTTKMSAYMVAEDNTAMGLDLVTTASEIISQMENKAERLRALSIQAGNGTYGAQSMGAIQSEASALMQEITRLYLSSEYNGLTLFSREEMALPFKAGKSGFIDETAVDIKPEYDGFIANPKTYTDEQVEAMTSIQNLASSSAYQYKIETASDLAYLATLVNNGQSMSSYSFYLANDIDLEQWCAYNGWAPIGKDISHIFQGTFNGNGHVIKNANISGSDYTGLFGYIADGKIENVGIEGEISGSNYTGSLVAYSSGTQYINCFANTDVFGNYETGGLIGSNTGGSITNCYTTGEIRSHATNVGGLIGSGYATITNCYSTANVIGDVRVGGLVGNASCDIINSYSTGNVNGYESIGGLVGESSQKITNCYSSGNVIGERNIGGLSGYCMGSSEISLCYSTGNIEGEVKVGGFIGYSTTSKGVQNCYSSSRVEGNGSVGNFMGYAETSDIVNSIRGCHVFNDNQYIGNKDDTDVTGVSKIKIQDTSTNLQIGINGDGNSRLNFNTNFQYDLSALEADIGSDSALNTIDEFINLLSAKQTELGAVQNRLESALDEIAIQYDNLASSRSTLRDADMAELSSEYIKMQILQQASATLLATANQSPSIALQLI